MNKTTIPFIVLLFFIASCANESAPTGGKRDSEPPKVKRITPANSTVLFNSKEINIRFDEFIQQPLNIQEVLVSPPMDKDPKYLINGKTVTIKLKSEPKQNTTYTINFGSSIKDNNEGNKLLNFSYVFSTGTILDSAKFSGNVINAKDLSPIEDVVVSIYPADSVNTIKNSRPFYFSKTDKSGNFQIKNIRAGRYQVFALKDQNLNYKYDLPNESIGYLDQVIEINDSTNPVNFQIFDEEIKKPKLQEAIEESPGKIKLIYNSPIRSLKLLSTFSSDSDLAFINTTKDTITYWYTNTNNKKGMLFITINDTLFDSTRISLTEIKKDSFYYSKKYLLNIEKQLVENKKGKDSTQNVTAVSPYKPLKLTLTRPCVEISKNKQLILREDSTKKIEKIDFDFDTISKIQFSAKKDWIENTDYTIIIPDSIFKDIFGFWNKAFSYSFKTDSKSNYGNVQLAFRFENPEKYYILKLIDQRGNTVQSFYYVGNKEKKVSLKNIKAGFYKLQAIEDVNHNGEWDTGNFDNKTQPERVINFKETYELKGSWDLEIEIKL